MYSRTKLILSVSLFAFGALSTEMKAQPRICQKISGTSVETILPQESAPNDPFGRITGLFTGTFAGVASVPMSGILASPPVFSTGFPGTPTPIQMRESYVTGPGESIIVTGTSIYNVAPAGLPGETTGAVSRCPAAPCLVQVPKNLRITGGTGRWAGATGAIRSVGIGNLNLTQSQGSFVFLVDGEVCLPAGSVSANSSQEKL